jgi:putative oxidoreductase
MANRSPLARKQPPVYEVDSSNETYEIHEIHPARQGWTPFLGRVFLSSIFILASFHHFTQGAVNYAAQTGLPYASILVPTSGVIALLGGLSVLLGYRTRLGAALLVLFLVPVTLIMHAFWNATDPATYSLQQAMFLKNLGLLGGALLVGHYGPGRISLDARRNAPVRV